MNAPAISAAAALLLVAIRFRPQRHRPLPLQATLSVAGGRGVAVDRRTRPCIPGTTRCHRVLARRGRAARRRTQAVDRALPDAIDLFVLTAHAGYSAREALQLLAPLVDPVVGSAFAAVRERVDRGDRLPDALTELPARLGPAALTFADTVAHAERTGVSIVAALGRLADDARHHRRRAAESAARELPVRLSGPLVLCTLPAFVLVAILPLLLGTLSSLRSPV